MVDYLSVIVTDPAVWRAGLETPLPLEMELL
jgi:hypothetical protein